MNIPFVIDNQQHKMADVLNTLLSHYKGQSLDVATAYFNVGGWQLLCDGLNGLGNFRLLLGDEPEAGFDLGLREVGAKPVVKKTITSPLLTHKPARKLSSFRTGVCVVPDAYHRPNSKLTHNPAQKS